MRSYARKPPSSRTSSRPPKRSSRSCSCACAPLSVNVGRRGPRPRPSTGRWTPTSTRTPSAPAGTRPLAGPAPLRARSRPAARPTGWPLASERGGRTRRRVRCSSTSERSQASHASSGEPPTTRMVQAARKARACSSNGRGRGPAGLQGHDCLRWPVRPTRRSWRGSAAASRPWARVHRRRPREAAAGRPKERRRPGWAVRGGRSVVRLRLDPARRLRGPGCARSTLIVGSRGQV
mmetsp:Transcript_14785/g.43438  ORF Transcript_14785/g.43438 Transcript_14785/m.43438 type:complete len:235 (+) Transcript_14785:281-985(+)